MRFGRGVKGLKSLAVVPLGGDGFAKWHADVQAVPKSQVGNSSKLGPILKNEGFSVVNVITATLLISGLNVLRCPSAIKGLFSLVAFVALSAGVIAEGVLPAKSMFSGRRISHVFQELSKRQSPPLADINTDSTVKPIIRACLISASLNHSGPNSVLAGSGKVSLSSLSAAATAAIARHEAAAGNDRRVAAFAQAGTPGAILSTKNTVNNCPFSEWLSSQVVHGIDCTRCGLVVQDDPANDSHHEALYASLKPFFAHQKRRASYHAAFSNN